MTSLTPRLSLVVLAVLAFSGCSASVGAGDTASATGGTIELAVSETCADGANPQCVLVNGENVVLPSAFERAGVEQATIADGEGQNAVDVTFNEDGAVVFNALTVKAVQAGDSARLIIQIGGEIQAAVVVMEALEGDHVQISISPDDSAQKIVDLIHNG
ncbi:hypothetical protein [Cryobacterium fucosi]|uniref:Uncharacterized protein n=1 Tax=Cryobacterium fucosi TaxID=1259157 RepID=A0A4R9B7C0_9MICO|nr:hypothetical protein [Cryobacterium fucosi]TFD76987.1 hypothetical protein E3T48_09575 [Cryobacterium fucosi]